MISKHHPDGLRTTYNCIVMLFNYVFARNWIFCIYANIQMWHLSIQIVKWCSKFNFKLLFCCWRWGAVMRTHPCTLNLLHIHVQRMHLSTKWIFSWFDFEETRRGGEGGRATNDQKTNPPVCKGAHFIVCDTVDLKDSSHFPSLNKVLTWGPRIFKAYVIWSSPLVVIIKTDMKHRNYCVIRHKD